MAVEGHTQAGAVQPLLDLTRSSWRLAVAALLLLVLAGQARADDGAAPGAFCSDPLGALRSLATTPPKNAASSLANVRAYASHTLTCPDGSLAPLPSLRARRSIETVEAVLALFVPAGGAGAIDAAATLARHADAVPPAVLQAALDRTHDNGLASAIRAIVVQAGLHAPDTAHRLAAIAALGGDARARNATTLAALLADPAYDADPAIRSALKHALSHVRFWLAVGSVLSLIYNGLSAGSVLFMAAVGLAIIFGLMGVINLAQGELIMIGAYTTYCVQQGLLALAPAWVAWYPVVSIPVVFAVTGAIGIVVEVAVIRHLYGRPLTTLLATWAVSLLLINLVRVIFGTQNVEFLTPPYLAGGTRVVGEFLVTWNHAVAIAAAVVAFAATAALLRFTDLGLFIRAVTQNRAMAGCVGVSTRRVDMIAFGFGAGLAGLGGLALSPIYNVNPSMGTGFIIDSFMVVVLGGVGSLLGTAVAALGIGLVDVGIEPFYGAVAAKVIALLLIIVIIQWRPEGLVAARGRR